MYSKNISMILIQYFLLTDMSNGTSVLTNGIAVKSNPRDFDIDKHCHVCEDKL